MSRIPKRKSRKIVIDGKPFRWVLKGGRIRYKGDSHRSVDLIVQEDADKPGDPMVTLFVSTLITEAMEDGYERHRAAITLPGACFRFSAQVHLSSEVEAARTFWSDLLASPVKVYAYRSRASRTLTRRRTPYGTLRTNLRKGSAEWLFKISILTQIAGAEHRLQTDG